MSDAINRRTALGVLGTIGAGGASLAWQPPSANASMTIGHGPGVFGRMSGAQAAVEALILQGTPCVFGIPGAQNNEFWDVMKSRGLPYLLVTHEASASVMADASARVTGRPGVFSVVPGPGLTNAMTGIGEALLDSVPIVGLVTDIDRSPGAPAFQVHSLPGAALLRPICKAVIEVQHPNQIPGAIFQAFYSAMCGEPGPAAVVLPYTFLNEVCSYDVPMPAPPGVAWDEGAYRKALCLLSKRDCRVGIYAGMGCYEAADRLPQVAELLQAPVATSVSGKGVIPDSHRLAVGWGYGPQGTRAAEVTFQDVDIVLAVGVRYSEVSTANYSIPKHDKVIHVDANPNNLGRNVPTDAAVLGDSRMFFDRLLADAGAVQRPPAPQLWKRVQELRKLDRIDHAQMLITEAVDPMYFLHQLRCALGCQELLFVDVTASTHWAAEAFEVEAPRRYFAPTNNQSMGWAIPASIAAQRVRPDRVVAAVSGDGCFLMSGIETSTAAREGLPVKFFVLDDGTYHYMQMLQKPVYRRTTATELAKIDFAAFAHAMGLRYQQICQNAEVAQGIACALATPGPVLTRVGISYQGREIRWLSALKASYLDRQSTTKKVRMATRVVARSAVPFKEND